MNKTKTIGGVTRLLPALLALTLSAPTLAGQTWYQIELLLFLNPAPGAEAEEPQPFYPEAETTIPLQAPREADAPYALRPGAEHELNAHRLQLNRSGRYESLLHLAWRQPVSGERNAETLSFRLPRPRADGLDQPASLQGTLRMSRGRFLHADLDASYLPPQGVPVASENGEPGMAQPMVYRLKEKRRMRSEELHYLDSPGLGALVIARPFEPEGEETEDPEAGQTGSTPETETKASIEPN